MSHALILESSDAALLRREGLARAAAWLCAGNLPGGAPCGLCPACRKTLAGEHTDLHLIDEGAENSVKVEQIRALRRALALRPVEGRGSCAVILHAQTLTLASQNALLLLLEEPPDKTRLVLCTDAAEALLPTVRSRCSIEHLQGGTDKEAFGTSPADRDAALAWLGAADDDWERTVRSYAWEKLGRDALRERLAALAQCLRTALESGATERLWSLNEVCRAAWDALGRNASAGIVCGLLAAGTIERQTHEGSYGE